MGNKAKIAVIGAGNGGQTSAGHFASLGFDVNIFDVNEDTCWELNKIKTIKLTGAVNCEGTIKMASTDIGKVVKDAKIIFITIPSIYHKSVVEKMAPYITEDSTIILHPGSTLSIIDVDNVLREHTSVRYYLAATCTLLYACRIVKNGEVQVFGIKDEISASALPASDNEHVSKIFNMVYPGRIEMAPNSIYVSMENLNCIVHPAPTILNIGRIESGADFQYYIDGFTPSIAKCAEKIDKERLSIAKAYGLKMPTCAESYAKEYDVDSSTLYSAIHTCRSYEGIMCGHSLETRYLLEDVPYCLVPLEALAKRAGIEVPTISAFIEIAHAVLGDKLDSGRTFESMKLDRFKTKDEFLNYIQVGG